MSRAWRLVSRASCTVVRLERAGQGGVHSGRAVARSSTRAVGLCAITWPSSSSVDASHQVAEEDRQLAALASVGSVRRIGGVRPRDGRNLRHRGGRVDPHEHHALEHRYPLHLHELFHQLVESVGVQLELLLQQAERDATVLP